MFSEGCVSHSGHRRGGGGGGVRGWEGCVVGARVTVGAYVAERGVCGWSEMCVVGAKHGWGRIPGVCCPGGGAMLSGGRCAV